MVVFLTLTFSHTLSVEVGAYDSTRWQHFEGELSSRDDLGVGGLVRSECVVPATRGIWQCSSAVERRSALAGSPKNGSMEPYTRVDTRRRFEPCHCREIIHHQSSQ